MRIIIINKVQVTMIGLNDELSIGLKDQSKEKTVDDVKAINDAWLVFEDGIKTLSR